MKILLRSGALVLLALLVGGCSVKFAYNNADRLLRWQVSEYIDLDREQKAVLSARIDEFMIWHRRTQLPEYADQMYLWSQQLTDQVTPEQIAGIFEQMLQWGERMEDRGLPIAVEIMAGLSDDQVAELGPRLELSNAEIAEPEFGLSEEEAQQSWAREFEDAMERFTGRLDIRQRDYIQRKAAGYQPERVLWAEYRRRWQADLLSLLDQRQSDQFAAAFSELSRAREAYYGDKYTRVSEENIELSREVAAYVLSNLSQRQSDRLQDSLTKLGDDFAELAATSDK